MLRKLIFIIFLLVLMGCNESRVTFLITVPKTTDQVTITGNIPQLGEWDPSRLQLKKINDTTWTIIIKLPDNINIEYKVTRGTWSTEALTKDGNIPGNNNLIIKNDTTISHFIPKWRDYNSPGNIITGNIEFHRNFYSPQLKNSRDISVWLPPSYNSNNNMRYPVLYLHDGQNVFDPSTSYNGIDWQLDDTVTKLIKENKMKEIIMVGINNTDERTLEYSPKQKGREYSRFLIETVKPYIDSTYRTLNSGGNTAVMGSSMGGIISFHLAWEFPEVFSMAGCLSPAFLVDNEEIVRRVINTPELKPIKLVILNGTIGLEAKLQPAITKMVNILESQYFDNLIYRIYDGAEHNEAAWSRQVQMPLLYFFGID